MTKFIDKTKEEIREKSKKETTFEYFIDNDFEKMETTSKQTIKWDFVELIQRKSLYYKFDLFKAYNEEKNKNEKFSYYLGDAGDEFD